MEREAERKKNTQREGEGGETEVDRQTETERDMHTKQHGKWCCTYMYTVLRRLKRSARVSYAHVYSIYVPDKRNHLLLTSP